jgi:hypothetical protein
MIVSHRKQFIFFHIGKTGGTTVEARLLEYHDESPGFLCFDPERYGVHSHASPFHLADCDDHRQWMEKYYKFCFVRNPYDFLYSVYQQWIKTSLIEAGDFNDWLTTGAFRNTFDTYSMPHVRSCVRLTNGFMHLYTHNERMCVMDFIGKIEFFETDFNRVCGQLGLTCDHCLNANVFTEPIPLTPGQDRLTDKKCYKYLGKYSKKAIGMVNETFRSDFALYRYPMFDPHSLEPMEM